MKSIAKNNFMTILKRFGENFKDFSSIVMGNSEQSNSDFSLADFSDSNPDIVSELLKSSSQIDKKANEYVLNIGIPSKPKKQVDKNKTSRDNSSVRPTVMNPIINKSTSNERNISLINNMDIER